ncbi:unnamed protein product [Calypogeia fissa]
MFWSEKLLAKQKLDLNNDPGSYVTACVGLENLAGVEPKVSCFVPGFLGLTRIFTMGAMMVRARGMNKWVITTYHHRIFVLALLQCLFFTSFTSVSGGRSHFDTETELHRSMARYRHLLESENSPKSDPKIQLDENVTMEKVQDELNLTNLDQQQQAVGLEKEMAQESKKVDDKLYSPTVISSTKVDELESPTQLNGNGSDQRDSEKGVEHEKVESSTPESLNVTADLDQHQQEGSEKEVEEYSKNVGHRDESTDEIPNENPEFDTKVQQQEVRERAKEGNTTNLEAFAFPDPYLLGPKIKDWDEQRSSWLEENPHMKSTPNKPRVLLVTGSQPKPCLSPTGDYFHVRSFKSKIDYARMHGFEMYYNFVFLDPHFGGYWAKLPILRKLMLTHPEIEWFFWVDSDAVFTDMLFEPPFHTYDGYNMVMWGWEDGLFAKLNWVAANTGVFLLRNCQWSLDLIDKWSPMGPEGPVRDEYGRMLSSFLSSRPDYPADDQSSLVYLLITDEAVKLKVKLVEAGTYLMSGFWVDVVDTYEDSAEKYHPGFGDKRWPWVTHFTGCGFCYGGSNPDYAQERCLEGFDRAFNFADNQVLAYMGFRHKNLSSHILIPTRHETDRPIEFVGVNPWEDRIAQVAAAGAAGEGT